MRGWRSWTFACAFVALTSGAQGQSTTLSDGRPVNGQLSATDARGENGSLKDTYLWNGRAGQRLIVTLRSDAFDALLRIEGPNHFAEENDDFGANTDAGLDIVLPAAGAYRIIASALDAEESGPYELKAATSGALESKAPAIQLPPGVTLPPEIARMIAQQMQPAQRPATTVTVGATTSARIDGNETPDDEGRPADDYVVRLRSGQHVFVIADSDVFDTFLSLKGPGLSLDNDNQHGFNYGAPRTYATTDIHDSALFVVAPADGEYRLSVARQQENERGGAYRLRVVELPRFVLGRDLRGDLSAGDFMGMSGEFRDSFGFRGTAGQRIVIQMTSEDFEPQITIWGRRDQPVARGPSVDVRLPETDEYRIDIASMWPKRVGDYLVRSAAGPLQEAPPAQTVAERLPSNCATVLARLEQQRARAQGVGGDQLAEINQEIARAHLCLDDFAAADRAFSEIVRTNGRGTGPWFDGVLSRIALAEMRGATAEVAALRRELSQGAGLAGLRYGGRLAQYGHADYILDPVDNLELLDFARMAELSRATPEAGVTVLAARYRTAVNAGRSALAERMAVLLARFASQQGRDFGCESLTHLGIAYAFAGQSGPAIETLRRALAKGKENTTLESEFRCGGFQDGSREPIERQDVIFALADAQVMGGDAAGAVATLREHLGQRHDQVTGVRLAMATEATGNSAAALNAWRTAMRWGMGVTSRMDGGSMHLVAADAFFRLGSPTDARQALEGFVSVWERMPGVAERRRNPPLKEIFDDGPSKEVIDALNDAQAEADLARRLESGTLSDALGCPGGRGSVATAGGERAMTLNNRGYYEYCRAWAKQAMSSNPRLAQQTAALLLAHAQREGWGEGEVRRLVEQNLESAWTLSRQD